VKGSIVSRLAKLEAGQGGQGDSLRQQIAYRVECALYKAYGLPGEEPPTFAEFLEAGGADAQQEELGQVLDSVYGG